MSSWLRFSVILAMACSVFTPRADAALFAGSSGALSASADFSVVGGQLQVLLTNTSNADVLVPSDVLTAVFFNIAGDPAFTSISALLGSGSSVVYGSQPAGGVVGGEWGYGTNLSGAPGGANQGISSSGLSSSGVGGLFGQPTFPGSNLSGPDALDGLQYGITSTGDNLATGNTGGTDSPLIKKSVVFTLGNVPVNFDPATFVTAVSFQYGTDLTEPSYTATCSNCSTHGGDSSVPEPATMLLLGGAVAALLSWRGRGAGRRANGGRRAG